jgi:hypothetical protein
MSCLIHLQPLCIIIDKMKIRSSDNQHTKVGLNLPVLRDRYASTASTVFFYLYLTYRTV